MATGAFLLGDSVAFEATNRNPTTARVDASQADNLSTGAGILILDPRDPLPLVRRLLQEFLIETGDGMMLERRRADVAGEVDLLFGGDTNDARGLPWLSLRAAKEAQFNMVAGFLKASDYFLRSDEVCQENCRFRDQDSDGNHVHFHLTRAAGGEGDTVLAFSFDEREQRPGQRLDYDLSDREELRSDWLSRFSLLQEEPPDETLEATKLPSDEHDGDPVTRLFGARVVVGNPVHSETP